MVPSLRDEDRHAQSRIPSPQRCHEQAVERRIPFGLPALFNQDIGTGQGSTVLGPIERPHTAEGPLDIARPLVPVHREETPEGPLAPSIADGMAPGAGGGTGRASRSNSPGGDYPNVPVWLGGNSGSAIFPGRGFLEEAAHRSALRIEL